MNESKDDFQGRVTGTVERVSPYSKGVVVTVAFKANPNAQYPDRVTCWDTKQETIVNVGDRVRVTGQVSWKVDEYNGKPRAQVSVNFPTFEVSAAPVALAPVDPNNTPF